MLRWILIASVGIAVLGATFFVGPFAPVVADDAPQATTPAAEGEAADPFAVPEGNNSQALQLFLRNLARTPPAERTPAGIRDHLVKMEQAIAEVLTREIDESLFADSSNLRLEILSLLERFGDETAAARRDQFLAALKKDPRPGIAAMAVRLELASKVEQLPALDPAERDQVLSKVQGLLAEKELNPESLQLAMMAAQGLEYSGDTKTALAALTGFSKTLRARNDERLESLIERLDATARRLALPGSEIKIAGTTFDGETFNIDQYEGRVVLVDFWATWCGPCIAELPNVKRLYEAYHEKGFEVVGISLDDDEDALREFLDDQDIEWITLFEEEVEKRGWENPIARYYGISGIPTAILVNQQGKVVSLQARGPELAEQLASLLGPVEETDK